MSIKNFISDSLMQNPLRYGIDRGDLHIINDYFKSQGWQEREREQHTAIASLLRERNRFLQQNQACDYRTESRGFVSIGQKSIYDFLSHDSVIQTQKIVRYVSASPERIKQSNSRIKKSVRDVDDNHITTVKVMYPLLADNPKLKPKRRQRKAPMQQASGADFDASEETGV